MAETTTEVEVEEFGAEVGVVTIPLDEIQTDVIKNYRNDTAEGLERTLVMPIHSTGRLTTPVQIFAIGAEGEEEFHVVAGFRRIAAAKRLRDLYEEHNKRVAEGNFEDVPENYPFRDDEGNPIQDELEFFLDDIPVVIEYFDELDATVISEARKANAQENEARKGFSPVEQVFMIQGLIDTEGMTQTSCAQHLGKTQGWISQCYSIARNCVEAVVEALRENKITVKQAVALSKLKTSTGKPSKRDQEKALGEMLGDKAAGKKEKTKRSASEIATLQAQLVSPEQLTDVDAARRKVIQLVLSWLNMGCETETLLYGDGEAEANLMAGLSEKQLARGTKKKKAAKAAGAKKKAAAADGKPATTRRRRKKADADAEAPVEDAEEVEAAEEVEEVEAAEEDAPEPMEADAPAEAGADESAENGGRGRRRRRRRK